MPKMMADGSNPAAGISAEGQRDGLIRGRLYQGRRAGGLGLAYVDGRPLKHVVVHSPTGFEWGYGGSGPADLALSILADFFGERQTPAQTRQFDVPDCLRAWRLHQRFKWAFVCHWGQDDDWQIDDRTIAAWVLAQSADAED